MAFHQVGGPSFQQLDDSTNPAAQSYARMALARNGIHVPPGADAAAMWRQYSQSRALQQNQAMFQSQNEVPDMGVAPGASAPPQGQPPAPGIGAQVGQHIVGRLPEGGYSPDVHPRQQMLDMNGIVAQNANNDWRMRIAAMASNLQNNPQFQALQGGPAEHAMNRLLHVGQATMAARGLAHALSHSRPSRRVPQGIMRTKAY